MDAEHFRKSEIYGVIRFFVCPFTFVSAVIFLAMSFEFSQSALNLDSLAVFSLGYGLVFSFPFILFNRLLIKFKRTNSFLIDFHKSKIKKMLVASIATSAFIVLSIITIQAVNSQLIHRSFLTDTSVLASTLPLCLVSAFFIGLFSLIFFFSEPYKKI